MPANMATRSPYLHVLFAVLLVYQVITHKSAVQQRFFFLQMSLQRVKRVYLQL